MAKRLCTGVERLKALSSCHRFTDVHLVWIVTTDLNKGRLPNAGAFAGCSSAGSILTTSAL